MFTIHHQKCTVYQCSSCFSFLTIYAVHSIVAITKHKFSARVRNPSHECRKSGRCGKQTTTHRSTRGEQIDAAYCSQVVFHFKKRGPAAASSRVASLLFVRNLRSQGKPKFLFPLPNISFPALPHPQLLLPHPIFFLFPTEPSCS